MVGQWPPPGLCSFSPERRRSADVKTIRELRISVTKQDERGWMSENYPSLQPREKCFLLTSPFIEPDLRRQVSRGTVCSLGQPNKAVVPRFGASLRWNHGWQIATVRLVQLQHRTTSWRGVKTIRELRISVTKHDQSGWMSENCPSFQRREKCFLLTSPFIE